MTVDEGRRREVVEKHGWAIDVVAGHFSRGLELWFEPQRIRQQVDDFIVRGDPVYSRLLKSSGRDLYETFVGYWKLGQTIASQSQFWLEAAICDIVRRQRSRFGTEVYALRDLPGRHGQIRRERDRCIRTHTKMSRLHPRHAEQNRASGDGTAKWLHGEPRRREEPVT